MDAYHDKYLKVIDEAPYAVIISDKGDHVLFANHQARQWFGKEGAISSMESILHYDPKKWQKIKIRVLEESSGSFETRAMINGMSDIDVHCRSITYGGKHAIVSFIRDISEQRYLEHELVSEKNMRELILDSIPALVFVKDDQNRLISMNRAYREITGLTMDEVAGRNVIEIMENRQLAESYWIDDLEVIETGLAKRNIIEPMITDEKKWFITDKIPFRDDKGKVVGVIGFSIDITERKNAEDALMRSEKKLRLLFDTSPDAIVISDLNGKFISTNEAFHNLLGYDYKDVVRLTFRDITPEQYPCSEVEFIKSALESDKLSDIFKKDYISANNLLIPVAVTCWMLHNEHGKPFQMVANIKDLTYQKKAEALEKSLLQKENEQLERDLLSKTQQLNLKITQLVEKNELVNRLVGQLQKLKGQQAVQVSSSIDSIIRDLKNNTGEDFWSQFETTFGQINQSFYDNLFRAYPNLTNNERKISAFLKMNLSTKEIANITHQSIRSIEMARSRLRTKLKLLRKENLSKFLNQF